MRVRVRIVVNGLAVVVAVAKGKILGHQLRELLKVPKGTDLYVEDNFAEDGERPVEPYEILRLRPELKFHTDTLNEELHFPILASVREQGE